MEKLEQAADWLRNRLKEQQRAKEPDAWPPEPQCGTTMQLPDERTVEATQDADG